MIIPAIGFGSSINSFYGITFEDVILLVFIINSIPFDFSLRLKLGGTTLNTWILYQQPIIPLHRVKESGFWERIKECVLRLSYYHELLRPFALDCGFDGPPFLFNEEERFELRCELDTICALLYGISYDECAYILDTFPLVKAKDEAQFGSFRTKERVLKWFGKLRK